jgi:alpha-L-rhamnosidase
MQRRKRERSTLVGLAVFLVSLGATAPMTPAAGGPLLPTTLRCEYLSNPLGIDVRQPRFAWVLGHTERGERQSAYQVLVATQAEILDQNRGDQWDSGRVSSDDSTQVVYGGKPLESGRTYFWKVRYWDQEGNPSAYSKAAQFEMGLLNREEWKAQWIGGNNLLRKEFTLSAKPQRARAYVAALGYYELRVNGEKIGDHVLDPGWTSYEKRVLYVTHDITAQLRQGANTVGVMLGGGWATQRSGSKPAYDAPAVLVQLEIALEGGKPIALSSDATWRTARGPILSDSIYDGEVYDARLEQPGWDAAGLDASGWVPAQVMAGSTGTLSAQMMPAIRVVDTLVPKTIQSPQPGVYVYDFGQNFSGWVELRVRGPRGATVEMRFSELLYANGMLNRENLRSAKARDIYVLRGDGEEVYEPRFTYHGFRYVELTGVPGTPNLDSIRGRVVHSAVRPTGSFVASKPILNEVQRLIRWGQATNLHSVPTDCAQRNERMGWLGDAHVTAEEAMLNFDMAGFYTNFVRDIRDVQDDAGTITDTVPHRYGSRPADPAWGTAYPLLVWYMYEQYGDRRIVEENYDGLKKYVEFLRTQAPDQVLRFSHYGDWIAIEPTPGELVSDAYFYVDVSLLARMAKLLGKSADEQTYSQLAGQIKDAFHREFYDPKRKVYASGTQTAGVLPLYFGLVPEDKRGAVWGHLFNDIVYAHDSHVTTGFIGVKYLMPLLTRMGASDLAYDLATQTTYPSLGYMFTRGATTLWELWQERTGPSMNSHNHPMLGSVGAWFYEALAGIRVDAERPGYQHIRIEPQMVRDLTWAGGTVETVRGIVSASWSRGPGLLRLEVEVPVNAQATVSMPKEEPMSEVTIREGGRVVWEKGQFVPGTPGITNGRREGGRYVFEVGSGHYIFELSGE